MPRFLKVFAFVGALFFTGNLFAAGYTCPAYVMYSSCNSGYYMTRTSSSSDTTHYGTPVAGNDCKSCMSGYTCAGGTAAPVAATRSCGAGTYWNGSACANCGGNGYYCPGFSNVSNPSSGYGRNSVASGYYSTGGSETTRTGQAACGGNAYYCSGGVRNTVSAGYYSTGGDANTRTSQAACGGNAYYCSGGVRNAVASGYYSTGGTATTRTGQSQCTGATYCSGGVSNGCPTNYTANTAAGKTAASQCQIVTSAGYYIATANATSQTICEAGYYCPAATINYGSTGSRGACPSGYTANTATGKSAITQCTISVAAGKYLSTVNTTTTGTCAAGTYRAAHTVAYGSTSSCSACTGATYSGAGAGSCSSCPGSYTANTTSNKTAASQCQISVAAGKYIASANTSTQTTCEAGYYCPGGLINYGSTGSRGACTGANYSGAGAASCSACPSGYTANTASNKTAASQCQISVAAGKYLSTVNTTTTGTCAAGTAKAAHVVNYGSTSSCSACTGATYAGAGAGSCSSCPSGYTYNTANNKTAATQCQLRTDAGKYIATANSATQTTCEAAYYCPAATINYGSTGSRGACPSGYTANTATGKSAITQCTISVAAGKYIATANTATQSTCAAGTARAAHTVAYGSTSACTACSGRTQYSAAGAGACSTVSGGYYTTGCNSSNNNCTGQSQCSGTTYCTGGVSNNCPDPTANKRTTFPANYYNPVLSSTSVQSAAGRSSINQCNALSWYDPGDRVGLYEYVSYNSSTGKYDNTTSWAYSDVKAGYYLTTKSGCGAYAYYSEVKECPAGSYCPGKSKVACNANNSATVHTTNFGLESCPSAYANSAVRSTSAAYCYLTTASTKYVASAGAGQVNCVAGNACAGGTNVYYSAGVGATTGGIAQCTGTNYAGAAASSCSACPSGYTANTTAGKTAASQCQISVAAGKYLSTVNTTTTGTCAAGTAKAAHVVNYGSTSSCAACTGATYAAAGAGSCSSCPSGYAYNTANNKTAATQCQLRTDAGKYIATANSATQTTCEAAYYCPASTINYGSTGGRAGCPTGYTADTSTGKSAASQCAISVAGGKYIATANTSTPTNCAAGTAKAAHVVNYGSTSACAACTGATYAGAAAVSCASCPTNYTANTASNKTAASQCQFKTSSTKWIATANATTESACTAGYACPGNVLVSYGSTGGATQCSGATYSAASAASCSSCPTNYTANTTAGKTAPSQCQFKTAAGKWIGTANATTEASCTAGYACAGNALVAYGSTGGRTQCTGSTYAGEGASSCSSCPTATSGWTLGTGTGWTSYTSCNQTRAATAVSSYCAAGTLKQNAASATTWGSTTISAALTAKAGAYVNGQTCGQCAAGTYQGTNGSTATSCTACNGSVYSGAGAASCTSCPSATSGWTLGTGSNWTSYANCFQTRAATAVSNYCAAGQLKQVASSASAWGESSISAAFTAKAGAYVNGQNCTACGAGTFQPTNGSTATSCSACVIGSYSAANAAACTACQNGTTTSAAGKASCDASCSNKNAYATNWTTVTWTNNTVANLCTVSGCSGGYYITSNACAEVGAGYWSEANSGARTECASGLTTVGYGAGADEAADCGRILNIGTDKLYLRSTKKTTPSLNVNVGGTTYYGNMDTSSTGKLKLNTGSTTYSVYDDSMQ